METNKMDRKLKDYNITLTLRGVSSLIASLASSFSDEYLRPTDESAYESLTALVVMIDRIIYDLEVQDAQELARLRAISEKFNIPMSILF